VKVQRRTLALAALVLTTACTTTRPMTTSAPSVPSPPPASSGEAMPSGTSSFTLFPQLKRDAGRLASAPFRWDGSDWTKLGIAAVAVGGALLLDEDVREIVHRNTNDTTRGLAKAAGPFGAEYSFAALGGFYLAGRFLKDDRARAVAEDGLASSLIAAGVITPILKATVGRRRPSQTGLTFARGDGGVSFPSGHTTQAFAVASVVAAHYDSLWIKAGAYAVAGLVGLSRMEENAHYASDVLAGALIGIAVGNAVVRIHDEERLRISAALPVNPSSRGMALTIRMDLADVFGLFRGRR
jgi:membrane-associated phospholipid phosphatase